MGPRQHRSFRFAPGVLERLEQSAAGRGVTQTALVERYVEEGLRMDDHPGICFADGPAGRRARVAGTGLDVREVVETVLDNDGSAAAAADCLAIAEQLVGDALRYCADFAAEIDDWIAANARHLELEQQAARDAGRTCPSTPARASMARDPSGRAG